jgi:hypothetical protein
MGDSTDLIELPRDKLMVGMALKYTLRDQSGTVLLSKGHKIDNATDIGGNQSPGKSFR